jgi:DNA-binding transcriptional MerR regulator
MLRPRKNRAGNRSYRVKDVKMALRIRKLLYDEGFTIAGARRKLLDERRDGQTELDFVGISKEEFLKMMRRDLTELLQVLRGEKPLTALGHQDDEDERMGGAAARRRGLFADLAITGEEEEDEEHELAARDDNDFADRDGNEERDGEEPDEEDAEITADHSPFAARDDEPATTRTGEDPSQGSA